MTAEDTAEERDIERLRTQRNEYRHRAYAYEQRYTVLRTDYDALVLMLRHAREAANGWKLFREGSWPTDAMMEECTVDTWKAGDPIP